MNKREKKKNGKVIKIRGQYTYESNNLMNTKSKTVPLYILEQIEVDGDKLQFREQCYTKFEEVQKDFHKIDTERIRKSRLSLLFNKGTNNLLANNLEQDSAPVALEGVPENISSNLVDYENQYDHNFGTVNK